MTDKPNTFDEMKGKETPNAEPVAASGEMDISNLSDTPVGEKVKYARPDLNGKEDVIAKYQVFMPDKTKDPKLAQSGDSKFWPVTQILTYESKNADGVQNREYISGARCFVDRDGGASEPSFWYADAVMQSQSAMVWERVAESIGIKPEEMTPRQFVAYLNNKPNVKIEGRAYDNYNAARGAPKKVKKNMPVFVKKG